MNVVLSICRKVIVNDQGNLLDINPTSLKGEQRIYESRLYKIMFKSSSVFSLFVARILVTDSYRRGSHCGYRALIFPEFWLLGHCRTVAHLEHLGHFIEPSPNKHVILTRRSVVINTLLEPDLNSLIITSRSFWSISPCCKETLVRT